MEKTTKSLCPKCGKIIQATVKTEGHQVFMHKTCPSCGEFKILIAKDAKRFWDKSFSLPGKSFTPLKTVGEPSCPQDCGWCSAHRQHVCTGLIEVTSACNMACPICYYGPKGAQHITLEEFNERLNTLMKVENDSLEVLQISGGECTIHPQFTQILKSALARKIGRILINTNGLALLEREEVYNIIRDNKDRLDVYLQFDGFDDNVYSALRGKPMAAIKKQIIEKLDKDDIKVCLAVTLYEDNLKDVPQIMEYACKIKNISGITFQRLTKQGMAKNTPLPTILHEDILQAMAAGGNMEYKDIVPLPCPHENCTSLAFLFCSKGEIVSLSKYINYDNCKEVLSNRIAFDKTILEYMKKNVCSCFLGNLTSNRLLLAAVKDFATGGQSSYKDMKILRILVKNFMDADTFDFERARKCCVGVSAGNGKIIPFCLYNNLKGDSICQF